MQGLFSSLVLENLVVVPERIFEANVSERRVTQDFREIESAEQVSNIIEETVSDITNKILNPIINSSTEEIEGNFIKRVFPFELRFGIFNRILFKGIRKEDLPKIIIADYSSFEEIKKDVSRNKKINDEYKSEIINVLNRIRDYDIAIFALAMKNIQQLIGALRYVDIDALRMSINSGILAFFCIVQFLVLGRDDRSKLNQLLLLANKNLETMEAWVDSINILNKQGLRNDNTPIEGDIGLIRKDGFQVDLNKFETGREYNVNYDSSEYKARKSAKGELILYEVG